MCVQHHNHVAVRAFAFSLRLLVCSAFLGSLEWDVKSEVSSNLTSVELTWSLRSTTNDTSQRIATSQALYSGLAPVVALEHAVADSMGSYLIPFVVQPDFDNVVWRARVDHLSPGNVYAVHTQSEHHLTSMFTVHPSKHVLRIPTTTFTETHTLTPQHVSATSDLLQLHVSGAPWLASSFAVSIQQANEVIFDLWEMADIDPAGSVLLQSIPVDESMGIGAHACDANGTFSPSNKLVNANGVVYVAAPTGLYRWVSSGNHDASSSSAWELLTEDCVSGLHMNIQHDPYFDTRNTTLFGFVNGATPNVFGVDLTQPTASVTWLLGENQLVNTSIIAITTSALASFQLLRQLVLLDTNMSYTVGIVEAGNWHPTFHIPKCGSAVSGTDTCSTTSGNPPHLLVDTLDSETDTWDSESGACSNGTQLELTHMASDVRISNTVFLFGNALLVSQDFGSTVWQVKTIQHLNPFAEDPIITQTSSPTEPIHVFQTHTGALWYCVNECLAVHSVPNTSKFTQYDIRPAVAFNELGEMAAVTADRTSDGELTLGLMDLPLQLESTYIQKAPLFGNCPINGLHVDFSDDPLIIRLSDAQLPAEDSFIPERVFLDHGDQYQFRFYVSFEISMGRQFVVDMLDRFRLVALSGAGDRVVDIHVGSEIDYHNMVLVFTVTLSNRDNIDDLVPFLGTVDIHFFYMNEPGDPIVDLCSWHDNVEAHPTFFRSKVAVYSGCPPGYSIELDLNQSRSDNEGCDDLYGVPCYYFENEFVPIFLFHDEILASSQNFDGVKEIQVVGGGTTLETTRLFTEEEMVAYSGKIMTQSAVGNATEIVFLCFSGSPCEQVAPVFPNTPDYYLVFQVKSRERSLQRKTFCEHETTFMLRVHNLPLSLNLVLVINLVTISFLMLVVGWMFARQKMDDKNKVHVKLERRSSIKKLV